MTALNTAGFAHPPRNVEALGIIPGMTVADFGAGSGHYVLEIAAKLKGKGHVYAIDVQQDLLRRIKNEAHKRNLKNVEIIWSDLEAPNGSKIADRHVDLVLISNLLFQVDQKAALLAEAWRIAKADGRVAIIDWSDPSETGRNSHGAGSFGPSKKSLVRKEQAIELAQHAGFRLLTDFDAGAHHYGLIFSSEPRAGGTL